MKKCIKCGSHAFNLCAEGIDQGGFCDVHYWQGRAHRAEAQPAQEPDELTIAYMSGLYDGKKKRPWVGLTDEEASWCQAPSTIQTWKRIEAKLKEKNA